MPILATSAIATFACIVIWRPFEHAAALHNTATLATLVLGCVALAVAASQVRDGKAWGQFAVHAVAVGFLIRALPALSLGYPPAHDGYYYYTTLLNVVAEQTLEPVYGDWYSAIGALLNWPLLQIGTAQAAAWTGIRLEDVWAFLPPALGSLTFLSASLIARLVSDDWRVAAIAGLLGSFADVVLFYQSEYHPQGLALTLFPVVVYLALAGRRTSGPGLRLLAIVCATAFLFAHHASSLLLPLSLAPVLLIPYLEPWGWRLMRWWPAARQPRKPGAQPRETSAARGPRALALVLIVAGLSMQLYLADDIFRLLLASPTASGVSPPSPDWWLRALRVAKYAALAMSVIGVVVVLRRPYSRRTFTVACISLVLGAAAVASIFVAGIGSDRLIGLWALFASSFAGVGILRLFSSPRIWITVGGIAIVAGYLAVSIVNSQPPAWIFEGTPRSAGVWYGNAAPRMDRVALAGSWLQDNTEQRARYAVDFATVPAPFFFARRPLDHLVYDAGSMSAYCQAGYFVRDYGLSDPKYLPGTIPLVEGTYSLIYDNGSVHIGEWSPREDCTDAPIVASRRLGKIPPRHSPDQSITSAASVLVAGSRIVGSAALVWALGFVAVRLTARGSLRPRQIEAASALLVGVGLSPLVALGPMRLLDASWGPESIVWATPISAAVGFVLLTVTSVRRHGMQPLEYMRAFARIARRLAFVAVTPLVVAAMLVAMFTLRPGPHPTIEFSGERHGDEIMLDMQSTHASAQECDLRVRDAEARDETIRIRLVAGISHSRQLAIDGSAAVTLSCRGTDRASERNDRHLLFDQ